jgi:hypothetical protein
MTRIKTGLCKRRETYDKQRPTEALEQALEAFIGENGGKSLGDLDTPSFMRRVCNVALVSQMKTRGGGLIY